MNEKQAQRLVTEGYLAGYMHKEAVGPTDAAIITENEGSHKTQENAKVDSALKKQFDDIDAQDPPKVNPVDTSLKKYFGPIDAQDPSKVNPATPAAK